MGGVGNICALVEGILLSSPGSSSQMMTEDA